MQQKAIKGFFKIALAMVLLAVPLSGWAGEKQPTESYVAMVNESAITWEEFDRTVAQAEQRFARSGKKLSDSQLAGIKKDVLEKLIERELLHQESQKKGFKVQAAEVDEQLSKMRSQYATEDEFKRALNMMGFVETNVESQIKARMEIQGFVNEQIAKNITIPETDIRASYDSHPQIFNRPENVRASHILIKVDPMAEESQKVKARKEIETIKKKLEKGEDFATLAKAYSQGPSSTKGGDLGYFGRGQMLKPFETAAFALKPGEVSDVVETSFGYHIIKVFDKRPETKVPYEEARDSIARYLMNQRVQKQVNQYVDELKKNAVIKTFGAQSR